MKTANPYTFLTLIGLTCCVWDSPNASAHKDPLFQEIKIAQPVISINFIENQSITEDSVSEESISIEEGAFRFAAW